MKKLAFLIFLNFCALRLLAQDTDVMMEDFESNTRDWFTTVESDHERVISRGKMKMVTASNTFYYAGQNVLPDKKKDFRVETELSFVKYKNGEAGIMWGDDKKGEKLYFFLLSPKGAWNFGTWSPQFFSMTGSQKSTAINKDLATNKLKIERVGSKLKLYINDVEVHSTKFPSTKGTLVGLVSGGGSHTVDAEYFNVVELAQQ
jgi:hypothetical protein